MPSFTPASLTASLMEDTTWSLRQGIAPPSTSVPFPASCRALVTMGASIILPRRADRALALFLGNADGLHHLFGVVDVRLGGAEDLG